VIRDIIRKAGWRQILADVVALFAFGLCIFAIAAILWMVVPQPDPQPAGARSGVTEQLVVKP
jgi:hypothetical protein